MKFLTQEKVREHDTAIDLVEVKSMAQFIEATGLRPLRLFMPAKRFRLRISTIKTSVQYITERRLNFWLGVCGCKAGGLIFLAALAWQISSPSQVYDSIIESVLLAAGLVASAGVAGKVAAVLIARAIYIAEILLFLRRSATIHENGSDVYDL